MTLDRYEWSVSRCCLLVRKNGPPVFAKYVTSCDPEKACWLVGEEKKNFSCRKSNRSSYMQLLSSEYHLEIQLNGHTNKKPTSEKTHFILTNKPVDVIHINNRCLLQPSHEIKSPNAECVQQSAFSNTEARNTCSNHCALTG